MCLLLDAAQSSQSQLAASAGCHEKSVLRQMVSLSSIHKKKQSMFILRLPLLLVGCLILYILIGSLAFYLIEDGIHEYKVRKWRSNMDINRWSILCEPRLFLGSVHIHFIRILGP